MIRQLARRICGLDYNTRQFGAFGAGSTIGSPRLVEGSKNILIGSRSIVRDGAWLAAYPHYYPALGGAVPRLVIEDDVWIGFYACITSVNSVRICEGTLISDGFYASDHTHGHDPREGSPRLQSIYCKGPVMIGKNCFFGYRTSVLPGVTIGDHCVIGAHSVVTRSFPAFSMIAGAPARLVKTFDFNSGEWKAIRPPTSPRGTCELT